MLLELTCTSPPATRLGYLLHKHPDKLQCFPLPFGRAHVFYPEANEARCTATLLLEIDPIGLVRRRGPGLELAGYVNDRPYVASSFLSVAIARVYGSALGGRCKDLPELAEQELEFQARLPVLPVRGGTPLLESLFAPLGYRIDSHALPMQEDFAASGESRYHDVTLTRTTRLADLLSHLYVLIPVLDRDKHYWLGDAEVEKLLAHGRDWLRTHPEWRLITRRYLQDRKHLTRQAFARLADDEGTDDDRVAELEERRLEIPLRLDEQRLAAVHAELEQHGCRTVLDLGCGEGRLLRRLLRDPRFERVVGVDVTLSALERAARRLHLDTLPPRQRARIELLHGSAVYADTRFAGFDAITLVEVVEHVDPPRLSALEEVVFGRARPRVVILTTPNREYNARFANLAGERLRHHDHRFEWTRAEFRTFAEGLAARRGYAVHFAGIGPLDPEHGAPTQLARFERGSEA